VNVGEKQLNIANKPADEGGNRSRRRRNERRSDGNKVRSPESQLART